MSRAPVAHNAPQERAQVPRTYCSYQATPTDHLQGSPVLCKLWPSNTQVLSAWGRIAAAAAGPQHGALRRANPAADCRPPACAFLHLSHSVPAANRFHMWQHQSVQIEQATKDQKHACANTTTTPKLPVATMVELDQTLALLLSAAQIAAQLLVSRPVGMLALSGAVVHLPAGRTLAHAMPLAAFGGATCRTAAMRPGWRWWL